MGWRGGADRKPKLRFSNKLLLNIEAFPRQSGEDRKEEPGLACSTLVLRRGVEHRRREGESVQETG